MKLHTICHILRFKYNCPFLSSEIIVLKSKIFTVFDWVEFIIQSAQYRLCQKLFVFVPGFMPRKHEMWNDCENFQTLYQPILTSSEQAMSCYNCTWLPYDSQVLAFLLHFFDFRGPDFVNLHRIASIPLSAV